MTSTFKMFANRKDQSLVGFSADDNAALLQAIATNAATSYVRQLREGGPISVPAHMSEKVKSHLIASGWIAA